MFVAAWCAMHMTVSRDHGGTGFPHTPARGRVWAGVAREQGHGEPGFPIFPHLVGGCGRATPSRRGMGEPGCPIFPPLVGGWGRA